MLPRASRATRICCIRTRARPSSATACCSSATPPVSRIRRSGEGIRPAVESGMMAAQIIAGRRAATTAGTIAEYERGCRRASALATTAASLASSLPESWKLALARSLMQTQWFTRNVVLNRWFLHADTAALRACIRRACHRHLHGAVAGNRRYTRAPYRAGVANALSGPRCQHQPQRGQHRFAHAAQRHLFSATCTSRCRGPISRDLCYQPALEERGG